jgi:putative zinc finger/helix-turn-helix YgiT family protein
MTCVECGGRMVTRRENYRYDVSGLPGVTLVGVDVRRCQECAYEEVTIPRIEDLHRVIARVVIQKSSRLSGIEIRFLRKYLGWSSGDFAKHMGAAPETVSRWETGKTEIGAANDRLLRLLVVVKTPQEEYPVDRLATLSDAVGRPRPIKVRLKGNKWQAAA